MVAAAREHFVQAKIVKKLSNKYFLDLDDGKNKLPESAFLLFDLLAHIETHTRCLMVDSKEKELGQEGGISLSSAWDCGDRGLFAI